MEGLRSADLEELAQELAESGAQEALSPKAGDLLRDLQAGDTSRRIQAAHQLGKLSASTAAIVQALIVAQESDGDATVRWYAADSLRAPVHQGVLQQHPELMERAQSLASQVAEAESEKQRAERRTKGSIMQDGNRLHAIGELEQKAARNPDNLVDVWTLADAYADHKRWPEAIETYHAALALSPDNADLHCNLGTVLEEEGSMELAEEAYHKAITLQPDHATAYFNLGCLYEDLDRIPQAVEAFKTCRRLSSDPDECSQARAKLNRIQSKQRRVEKVAKASSPADIYAKMQKQVRSWGLWMLVFGALSLIISGLSDPWGFVVLMVGLASFVFRETPMFVVYGTILAWVALNNMLSGQVGVIVFGVFGLVLSFLTFRSYTRFRRAEKALDYPPGPQRASRAFPQIGGALGALALVGFGIVIAGGVILALAEVTQVPVYLVWLEGLVINLAVLGLAVAVASLLSGYRHKVMAVLGIVASSLVLLLELVFTLTL
jgi:tetratricopeptide (TPR) repeat protein